MSEAQLTFYGGVGTSGGVQVLFAKGKQALLFDFGVEHRSLLFPTQATVMDPVNVTPGRELRQFLLAGMSAPLMQLYDPEQIKGLDLAKVPGIKDSLPEYEQTSVFISHMHTDHMALLPYANPELPIYMSHDSYALFRGMAAGGHIAETQAHINLCEDKSVIDFGGFTVQVAEMDHNATGNSGIIIDDGTHKIAYTSDWRWHGKHPEKIDQFIELCGHEQIDLLITEGSFLTADPASVPHRMTEDELLARYAEIIEETEGLLYLQMSPRDLVRMAEMISIAAQKGKKIVMESSLAAIWHASNQENVKIIQGHPALEVSIQIVDVTIKDGVACFYETITLEEIAAQKSDYVYFYKFPDLAHLIEIETLSGQQGRSQFIQSDYAVKIDHPKLVKFLEAHSITAHSLCNGGHAHPQALAELIERMAPKRVITLHSNHPTSQDTRGVKPYYPTKGETISLSSIL